MDNQSILKMLDIDVWTVRSPELFGSLPDVNEFIAEDVSFSSKVKIIQEFGDTESDKLFFFLMTESDIKYVSLLRKFLLSMFGRRRLMVGILTQEITGIRLNEITPKYSTFNLLKSTKCNIVKSDVKINAPTFIDIDLHGLLTGVGYKKQVMLDVFRLSDYAAWKQ